MQGLQGQQEHRGMPWEGKGRKRTAHTRATGTWLFFFSRMVVPSSTSNSPWSLKHRTCKSANTAL